MRALLLALLCLGCVQDAAEQDPEEDAGADLDATSDGPSWVEEAGMWVEEAGSFDLRDASGPDLPYPDLGVDAEPCRVTVQALGGATQTCTVDADAPFACEVLARCACDAWKAEDPNVTEEQCGWALWTPRALETLAELCSFGAFTIDALVAEERWRAAADFVTEATATGCEGLPAWPAEAFAGPLELCAPPEDIGLEILEQAVAFDHLALRIGHPGCAAAPRLCWDGVWHRDRLQIASLALGAETEGECARNERMAIFDLRPLRQAWQDIFGAPPGTIELDWSVPAEHPGRMRYTF